jgi:myosin heavy subunit
MSQLPSQVFFIKHTTTFCFCFLFVCLFACFLHVAHIYAQFYRVVVDIIFRFLGTEATNTKQKLAELNTLNTQLAANLFLRTTTLRVERDQAVQKCDELNQQLAVLHNHVDRYAAVNSNLLREGGSIKGSIEEKDRELAAKTQELLRVKQMLSSEAIRRETLEEECVEMAQLIKSMEKDCENLESQLTEAQRRNASLARPQQPKSTIPPVVTAELSMLKQKESALTASLQQATESNKSKSTELATLRDSLNRKSMENYICLLLCVLLICVQLLSSFWPIQSMEFPSCFNFTVTKAAASTLAVTSDNMMAGFARNSFSNCMDPFQCTSQ